jgi:hypothetical protein
VVVAEIRIENAFIKRFEAAAYDRVHLALQHARVRRDAASAAGPRQLHLDVTAFNRSVLSFLKWLSYFLKKNHLVLFKLYEVLIFTFFDSPKLFKQFGWQPLKDLVTI